MFGFFNDNVELKSARMTSSIREKYREEYKATMERLSNKNKSLPLFANQPKRKFEPLKGFKMDFRPDSVHGLMVYLLDHEDNVVFSMPGEEFHKRSSEGLMEQDIYY